MKKIKAILIGAGDRGAKAYAPYANNYPNELEFVAVAEAILERREAFAKEFSLAEEQCYTSWEEMLENDIEADVAFICTLDRGHYEPTVKAIEKGYHVLLEKPMSPSPKECVSMVEVAKEHQKLLTICHVLRYTPFWQSIKTIIDEGKNRRYRIDSVE